MNNIFAIIFDLDGVICSTDRYHYLAWKALSERLGIPFDEQINSQLRGVSRMESLEIVLGEHSAEYSEEQKLAFATEKNEIYKSYLSAMTPGDLSKEVRMTLHTLRQRGYLLAIGSSSKNTPFILERIGLGAFFDAIADGNCIIYIAVATAITANITLLTVNTLCQIKAAASMPARGEPKNDENV